MIGGSDVVVGSVDLHIRSAMISKVPQLYLRFADQPSNDANIDPNTRGKYHLVMSCGSAEVDVTSFNRLINKSA